VNFRRDALGNGFRGSLFSNQEFAIAYALGFRRLLVVNQEGVLPEGMLRYVGINTERFCGQADCCAVVGRALDRATWQPDYSRRLTAGELRLSPIMPPTQYGNLVGRFLYLDIRNDRPDIAALECTARLFAYAPAGRPLQLSRIRSPLKATGRPGFSHTIFPQSHEAFDLLCVGVNGPGLKREARVYLNSALDVSPLPDLGIAKGAWILQYQFFAIEFPILTVTVELSRGEHLDADARILEQGLA